MKNFLIFKIILLTLILLSILNCSSYPSDKYLIENFNNNRENFEKLLVMVQTDKQLIRIKKNGEVLDITYKQNDTLLSSERVKEYTTILNKINALDIRIHTDNKKDNSNFDGIDICVWDSPSWSIVGGGKSKSFVYLLDKPEQIVESLDKLYYGGGDALHYKKVDTNWYLFLDIW